MEAQKKHTLSFREAGYFLLGLVSLATVTGLYSWLDVPLVAAASTYLVVLVLLALVSNLSSLIVLSFIEVGCLSYFFAPPIYSFRVDYHKTSSQYLPIDPRAIDCSALNHQVRPHLDLWRVATFRPPLRRHLGLTVHEVHTSRAKPKRSARNYRRVRLHLCAIDGGAPNHHIVFYRDAA